MVFCLIALINRCSYNQAGTIVSRFVTFHCIKFNPSTTNVFPSTSEELACYVENIIVLRATYFY